MKALVYNGLKDVSIKDIDDPQIGKPTDAVIKIMGVVEAAGEAAQQIKVGDRVVLPFNIGCGLCFNCVRGYTNAAYISMPMRSLAPHFAGGSSGILPAFRRP